MDNKPRDSLSVDDLLGRTSRPDEDVTFSEMEQEFKRSRPERREFYRRFRKRRRITKEKRK